MKIKFLIILLLILFTTGCWNYRELNDLAIISALSIEKKEDKFIMIAQIMNTKKTGSDASSKNSNASPITTIRSEGSTMHEAIRNMTAISPRQPYSGHIDLVILDEQTAKNNINDVIDLLIRDHESRKQFKMIVAQNVSTEDLLNLIIPLESIPSKDIILTIENANSLLGSTSDISYDQFISSLLRTGIEAVLPSITITGNIHEGSKTEGLTSAEPVANIKLLGLGVFKANKLLGFLSEKETMGFNFIRGTFQSSAISFSCDEENNAAIEVTSSKSSVKIDVENEKPKAYIQIYVDSFLSEINCNIDIVDIEVQKKLEQSIEQTITSMAQSVIEKAQKEYNSDILGFGRFLYQNRTKYWKSVENNWYQIFPNMEYEIKTDVDIVRKGASLQPAMRQDEGV